MELLQSNAALFECVDLQEPFLGLTELRLRDFFCVLLSEAVLCILGQTIAPL